MELSHIYIRYTCIHVFQKLFVKLKLGNYIVNSRLNPNSKSDATLATKKKKNTVYLTP